MPPPTPHFSIPVAANTPPPPLQVDTNRATYGNYQDNAPLSVRTRLSPIYKYDSVIDKPKRPLIPYAGKDK